MLPFPLESSLTYEKHYLYKRESKGEQKKERKRKANMDLLKHHFICSHQIISLFVFLFFVLFCLVWFGFLAAFALHFQLISQRSKGMIRGPSGTVADDILPSKLFRRFPLETEAYSTKLTEKPFRLTQQ